MPPTTARCRTPTLILALAAVVAAATAAGTSYLFLRYAPLPALADQRSIERITRDYLTKNPDILVEMTNELDKRQAAEQAEKQQKVIGDNAEAIFRSPLAH